MAQAQEPATVTVKKEDRNTPEPKPLRRARTAERLNGPRQKNQRATETEPWTAAAAIKL